MNNQNTNHNNNKPKSKKLSLNKNGKVYTKIQRRIYRNEEELRMRNNYENFLKKQPNIYSGFTPYVYFRTRVFSNKNEYLSGANKRYKLSRNNKINKRIIDNIKKVISEHYKNKIDQKEIEEIEEMSKKYFDKIIRFCQYSEVNIENFDICRQHPEWLQYIEQDLKGNQPNNVKPNDNES